MSFDVNVFIEREKMLSRDEWQSKIDLAGFLVSLYPSFNTKDMSGILPCTLGDKEASFEYYFDALEDTMFDSTSDDELANRLQNRDTCVGFSVAAGLPEESTHAAMFAAATSANELDGLLWVDPDFIEAENPILWVKNGLE